ncbi:hypothetical protein A2Y83_01535 [Candidatus Falkowbacteria bacterium RBG_13_39_14]|uniref:Uncharacterized protein n=1 Tax=Candidatus Falkowbacteria bacterium RBG_13_39_14 TaxID=1797985 RepID=A0A1F5S6K6_9BACT|nr:MAG: hypothetical protein A2Y83_01535 [Candidatus Falkowbacteria bacterium RBG_13_39_14]
MPNKFKKIFCKEVWCVNKGTFGYIIKFWKKYKLCYIVFMVIIFIMAFFSSRFYREEKIFTNFFGNIIKVRL